MVGSTVGLSGGVYCRAVSVIIHVRYGIMGVLTYQSMYLLTYQSMYLLTFHMLSWSVATFITPTAVHIVNSNLDILHYCTSER